MLEILMIFLKSNNKRNFLASYLVNFIFTHLEGQTKRLIIFTDYPINDTDTNNILSCTNTLIKNY